MKKTVRKLFLALVLCWALLVAVDASRIIGSTDPNTAPILYFGTEHVENELTEYDGLGYSVTYTLTDGNEFVSGEFDVLGARLAAWIS